MQGEKEKVRDTTEGSGQQQAQSQRDEANPVGQDSAKNEYGEIGDDTESTSEPPRSMGTRGTEFGQFGERGSHGQQGQSGTGQADLGSQAGSTLSGRTDQQELGKLAGEVDQPGSTGATQGQGFILQQGTGSDDLRQRGESSGGPTNASSARATEGTDFAPQGRGATEDEDEESETGPRDAGSEGPGSSM